MTDTLNGKIIAADEAVNRLAATMEECEQMDRDYETSQMKAQEREGCSVDNDTNDDYQHRVEDSRRDEISRKFM